METIFEDYPSDEEYDIEEKQSVDAEVLSDCDDRSCLCQFDNSATSTTHEEQSPFVGCEKRRTDNLNGSTNVHSQARTSGVGLDKIDNVATLEAFVGADTQSVMDTRHFPTLDNGMQHHEGEVRPANLGDMPHGCCSKCGTILCSYGDFTVVHTVCPHCFSKEIADPKTDDASKRRLLLRLSESLDRIACRLLWNGTNTGLERVQAEIERLLSAEQVLGNSNSLTGALKPAIPRLHEAYRLSVDPLPTTAWKLTVIRRFMQDVLAKSHWDDETKIGVIFDIVDQVDRTTKQFEPHWMPTTEVAEENLVPSRAETEEILAIRELLQFCLQNLLNASSSSIHQENKLLQILQRLTWIQTSHRSSEDQGHHCDTRRENETQVNETWVRRIQGRLTEAEGQMPSDNSTVDSAYSTVADDTLSHCSESSGQKVPPRRRRRKSSRARRSSQSTSSSSSVTTEPRPEGLLETCQALRELGSPPAVVETLQRSIISLENLQDMDAATIVDTMLYLMTEWAANPDIQTLCCLFLDACAKRVDGELSFFQSSCLTPVLDSMERNVAHAPLQESGCKLIFTMVERSGSELSKLAIQSCVTNAMRQHRNNEVVQSTGCKTLWSLLQPSEETDEDSVTGRDLVALVTHAMNTVGSSDVESFGYGCRLLWLLARRNHNYASIRPHLQTIIEMMGKCDNDPSIQYSTCGLLADMAVLDPLSKEIMHREGAHEAFVAAISRHRKKSAIVQNALEAMRNLACEHPSTQEAIVAMPGSIALILDVMVDHNNKPRLQVAGLGLLIQLVNTGVLPRRLMGMYDENLTGVEIVFAALGRHVLDVDVQLLGLALLVECINNADTSVEFGGLTSRGVCLILLAMDSFAVDEVIQQYACYLLGRMLELNVDDAAFLQQLAESKAAPVLSAIRRHAGNPVLLQQCFATLSQFLLRKVGGVPELTEMGAVLVDAVVSSHRGLNLSALELLKAATTALGNTKQLCTLLKDFCAHDGISVLSRSMVAEVDPQSGGSSVVQMQIAALDILQAICQQPLETMALVATVQQAVVSTMNRFVPDGDIQMRGCAVLACLAGNHRSATTTNDSVVRSAVVASLAHMDNATVQTESTRVLRHAAKAATPTTPQNRMLIFGVERIVNVLLEEDQHNNNDDDDDDDDDNSRCVVLQNGCGLVASLLQNPQFFRACGQKLKGKVFQAMLKTMKSHPNNETIQTSGRVVLDRFIQNQIAPS